MKVVSIKENIIYIIFLFIFFANFSLFNLAGRGILIPEILIMILIIYNLIFYKTYKFIFFFIGVMSIPLLLNIKNLNNIDFFKSYVLFVLYLVFVYISNEVKNKEKCLSYYSRGICILVIFGIFQFLIRILDVKAVLSFVNNPLFSHTIGGNLEPSYFLGIQRTNSLYYEPSIFGLISLTGIGVAWYLCDIKSIYYKKKYLILSFIGVVISLSASALCGLAVLILIRSILSKRNFTYKLIIIILSVIVFGLLINMIANRLNEVLIEGTSGYYRIISPLKLIVDVMKNGNIFGVGIGQIENFIRTFSPVYMYKKGYLGLELGYTIDNSLYMIILTFGIISIPIIFIFIRYIIKSINRENIFIFIAFLFVACGTGGYNFIYFNTTLAIMIMIFNNSRREKNEAS